MTEIFGFLKDYWPVLSGVTAAVVAVGGWLFSNKERFAKKRELKRRAKVCVDLLVRLKAANDRIILRGTTEGGPWARLQNDNYNHVCGIREKWRTDGRSLEPYFDAICPDLDLETICVSKWVLGEKINDYRDAINGMSKPPEHDHLELLIRRSIVQPEFLSPKDLGKAVDAPIENARRMGIK